MGLRLTDRSLCRSISAPTAEKAPPPGATTAMLPLAGLPAAPGLVPVLRSANAQAIKQVFRDPTDVRVAGKARLTASKR